MRAVPIVPFALVLALLAGCRGGAASSPAPPVPPVGAGFATLAGRFDADAAHVRVLALLSPT